MSSSNSSVLASREMATSGKKRKAPVQNQMDAKKPRASGTSSSSLVGVASHNRTAPVYGSPLKRLDTLAPVYGSTSERVPVLAPSSGSTIPHSRALPSAFERTHDFVSSSRSTIPRSHELQPSLGASSTYGWDSEDDADAAKLVATDSDDYGWDSEYSAAAATLAPLRAESSCDYDWRSEDDVEISQLGVSPNVKSPVMGPVLPPAPTDMLVSPPFLTKNGGNSFQESLTQILVKLYAFMEDFGDDEAKLSMKALAVDELVKHAIASMNSGTVVILSSGQPFSMHDFRKTLKSRKDAKGLQGVYFIMLNRVHGQYVHVYVGSSSAFSNDIVVRLDQHHDPVYRSKESKYLYSLWNQAETVSVEDGIICTWQMAFTARYGSLPCTMLETAFAYLLGAFKSDVTLPPELEFAKILPSDLLNSYRMYRGLPDAMSPRQIMEQALGAVGTNCSVPMLGFRRGRVIFKLPTGTPFAIESWFKEKGRKGRSCTLHATDKLSIIVPKEQHERMFSTLDSNSPVVTATLEMHEDGHPQNWANIDANTTQYEDAHRITVSLTWATSQNGVDSMYVRHATKFAGPLERSMTAMSLWEYATKQRTQFDPTPSNRLNVFTEHGDQPSKVWWSEGTVQCIGCNRGFWNSGTYWAHRAKPENQTCKDAYVAAGKARPNCGPKKKKT
ncbi:hypothetical protein H2203_007554 [Taxawa tesnikishii (nom. ined.)]|nr:hypothetical protein H2203_007554 [Dothideales sp. JES 119]